MRVVNSMTRREGAVLAAAVMCVAPSSARAQPGPIVKDIRVVAHGYRASKLIGSRVFNDKNEQIGEIEDLVIDRDRVLYAVLHVGGFLGLAGHLVVVLYDRLVLDAAKKRIVFPGADRAALRALSKFQFESVWP